MPYKETALVFVCLDPSLSSNTSTMGRAMHCTGCGHPPIPFTIEHPSVLGMSEHTALMLTVLAA